MKFFESSGGSFYPVSNIERMRRSFKDREGRSIPAKIYLKDASFDDAGIEVESYTIDDILQQARPLIAAVAGFQLLKFWYSPELWKEGEEPYEPFIDSQSVLGWRHNEYGNLEPLAYDMDNEGLVHAPAVEEPNGRIRTADGERYVDRAAWIAELTKRATNAAKAKVAPSQ